MNAIMQTRRSVMVSVAACALAATGCMDLRVPDPNVEFIAFGDSTTAGPSSRDYVAYLPQLLNKPTNAFTNEGKGGETSDDGLDRLKGLFDQELFPNARVLLYWEGGNDLIDLIAQLDPLLIAGPDNLSDSGAARLENTLDDIQANIESAIDAARAQDLDVYVATYFPLQESFQLCDAAALGFVIPGQVAVANAYRDELNDRIRLAALTAGATLVDIADLGAALAGDNANYENCNHLSADGNAIVAGEFADELIADGF